MNHDITQEINRIHKLNCNTIIQKGQEMKQIHGA
jgi:hypothetical protein